jgi:hypothetical protein
MIAQLIDEALLAGPSVRRKTSSRAYPLPVHSPTRTDFRDTP